MGGRKSPFPITLAIGLYNSLYYRTSRDIPTGAPNEGVECRWARQKSRFSTNISLYLGNDTRYGHSYYGMRIGNRTQAFEWYHFQSSCSSSSSRMRVMNHNHDLKQPLTKISRSRHYLALNISETIQDADIVTLEY